MRQGQGNGDDLESRFNIQTAHKRTGASRFAQAQTKQPCRLAPVADLIVRPLAMRRDFEIKMGIYLVQPPHKLDLHNFFGFRDLRYSVADRTLVLQWRRSQRGGVPSENPASVTIEFRGVTEFRFQPRDPAVPFTEDDCLSGFGYWTDEDWADGVIYCDPPQTPDPGWLTAIKFMSGAVIAVQADSAHATIAA